MSANGKITGSTVAVTTTCKKHNHVSNSVMHLQKTKQETQRVRKDTKLIQILKKESPRAHLLQLLNVRYENEYCMYWRRDGLRGGGWGRPG